MASTFIIHDDDDDDDDDDEWEENNMLPPPELVAFTFYRKGKGQRQTKNSQRNGQVIIEN
jgi:hypothetical protein